MIALLQRVLEAEVRVEGVAVASIGRGLLVFVGVRPEDDVGAAQKLLDKLLKYRVFGDEHGKMNLNLSQIDGSLLLVPQFTLAADTRHGLRPGFSTAAAPEQDGITTDESIASPQSESRFMLPVLSITHPA